MTVLGRALLDGLDDDDLAALAARLLPLLTAPVPLKEPQSWLNAAEAASYLGLSVHALRKLTARRAIPFAQDGPGCKLWFERPALDQWRRDQGGHHRSQTAGPRFHHASRGEKK